MKASSVVMFFAATLFTTVCTRVGGAATAVGVVDIHALLDRGPGIYRDVYPGISLHVQSHAMGLLEYDWIVAPGAHAGAIRMSFGGQGVTGRRRHLSLDAATGSLVILDERQMVPVERHTKPHAFQIIHNRTVPVAAEFALLGEGEAGFHVGGYDPAHALVIDPVVLSSVSLGGRPGPDRITALATDADGFVYVAGEARSPNFPTTEGAFLRKRSGDKQAFVAKLSREGDRMIFSTFVGPGSPDDAAWALVVDRAGAVYVSATTNQRRSLLKVRPDGGAVSLLVEDLSGLLALGPTGDIHFVSTSIGKIKPTGELVYRMGIHNQLRVHSIAAGPDGSAYVAGETNADSLAPTPGAFQASRPGTCGGCNRGFVLRVNREGTGLIYATYLGGSQEGHDYLQSIAVDADGNAYVTGWTTSPDFPVTVAPLSGQGKGAILSKLDPLGSKLLYSQVLGDTLSEGKYVAVQGERVYVAGEMYRGVGQLADEFPQIRPIQAGIGSPRTADGRVGGQCMYRSNRWWHCRDVVIAAFVAPAMQPDFSSYLGWEYEDTVVGLAAIGTTEVVVAGNTQRDPPNLSGGTSLAWPLPGSTAQSNFITRIDTSSEVIGPVIRDDWVRRSSSLQKKTLAAAGALTTLFGTGISTQPGVTLAASDQPLPVELDGVSVEVGGVKVPLYSISNMDGVEQINFQMPWVITPSLGAQYVHVAVKNNGKRSLPAFLQVASGPDQFWPDLFRRPSSSAAGDRVLAVRTADGSLVSRENPARRGEVVRLFATGMGPVDPPVATGYASPADPPSRLMGTTEVQFGEPAAVPGEVQFSGLLPGVVGVYLVDVKVAENAPQGTVGVTLLVTLTDGVRRDRSEMEVQ